jgi:hypothetical protein
MEACDQGAVSSRRPKPPQPWGISGLIEGVRFDRRHPDEDTTRSDFYKPQRYQIPKALSFQSQALCGGTSTFYRVI